MAIYVDDDIVELRELKNELEETLESPEILAEAYGLTKLGGLGSAEASTGRVVGFAIGKHPDYNGLGIKAYIMGQARSILRRLCEIQNIRADNIFTQRVRNIRFLSLTTTDVLRPVPGGVSIGHYTGGTGTLACWVKDEDDNMFMLSNNHVIANADAGRRRDPILQPGIDDGGGYPENMVGRLSDFVPLMGRRKNRIDAAIARPSDPEIADPRIWRRINIVDAGLAEIGMRVKKYGRTSGHTIGIVTGIEASMDVSIGGTRLKFIDQIEITPAVGEQKFSAPGDSGSLVLDRNNNAVGLLFAGDGEFTWANPIQTVLDEFDICLVTE